MISQAVYLADYGQVLAVVAVVLGLIEARFALSAVALAVVALLLTAGLLAASWWLDVGVLAGSTDPVADSLLGGALAAAVSWGAVSGAEARGLFDGLRRQNAVRAKVERDQRRARRGADRRVRRLQRKGFSYHEALRIVN